MTNFNEGAQNYFQANYSYSKPIQYDPDAVQCNNLSSVDRGSYVDIDKLTQKNESESAEHLVQSYERDGRWKPHLSWSFLSWSLQQRMEEQAAQRELAWQRIADKLGPLLTTEAGYAFGGPRDYGSELSDERRYERVPFVSNHSPTDPSNRRLGMHKHTINQCQPLMKDRANKGNRFTLNGGCDYDHRHQHLRASSVGSESRTADHAADAFNLRQCSISDYGGLSSSKYSSENCQVSKLSLNDGIAIDGHKEEVRSPAKRENDHTCTSATCNFNSEQGWNSYSFLDDKDNQVGRNLKRHNRKYEEEAKYYQYHRKARKRCLTVSGLLVSSMALLIIIVTLMALGVLHR